MADETPFNPNSLTDWIDVLHGAASVPKGHPDYQEARQTIALALRKIHALGVAAGNREVNADQPSGLQSLEGEFLHTGGAGTGELFSGLASAARGKGFKAGAEGYREAVDALEGANPTAANLGAFLALITPGGVEGTVAKPGVRGAVTALAKAAATGATLGGLSGFSAGGADAGDFPSRVRGAGRGAAIGAVLGTTGAATGLRYARPKFQDFMDLIAPRRLPKVDMELTPEGVGTLQPMRRPAGDPLDVPTFKRRAIPPPEEQNSAAAEIDRLLMLLRRGR